MLCEFIRLHWRDVLSAAWLAILVTVASAVIGWRQLDYAKKRDAAIDARNQWERIHKAMLEFRFRREVVTNRPKFGYGGLGGLSTEDFILAANALHMLQGELDRAPESPLVTEIFEYVKANSEPVRWTNEAFAAPFDDLARRVASESRA